MVEVVVGLDSTAVPFGSSYKVGSIVSLPGGHDVLNNGASEVNADEDQTGMASVVV